MTNRPHDTSIELAERLGATALVCEVFSTARLSSSIHEVVLAGETSLAGVPGNDVMIRVANAAGKFVRRRYSVRDVSTERGVFTLWITTGHEGAGSSWARIAAPGDPIDVIGPRGKIVLDERADWHLFVGDTTGLASFYRMAQAIELPGQAIFIVEIDHPDDALTTDFDEGLGVTGIFVERLDRALNDPTGLQRGLAAFAFPPNRGHAYLLGEFHRMRALRVALLDRGLNDDDVSVKAYWRTGRENAEHGEPDKSED